MFLIFQVPLSDKTKIKAMIPRCYLQQAPEWRFDSVLSFLYDFALIVDECSITEHFGSFLVI